MDFGRYAVQNIPGDILLECGGQFAEHGWHNVESVSGNDETRAIELKLTIFSLSLPLAPQVHIDCLPSSVRTHLSASNHHPAIIPGVVLGTDDHDATAIQRLGHTGPRRVHILVHNTQEKWQIDKEVPVFRGIPAAVRGDHHIVFLHLLHSAKATPEIEQTHNGST